MMPSKSRFPQVPFRAGAMLGILAIAIVCGYTLYAALPYLLGPSLTVAETTENGMTTVSGTTARVAFLSIDGAPVPLQENGSFSAKRAYPPGYTAVEVTVKDRFGRSLTKTITFVNK